MPLDADVVRLAKGKNLATVVTLMPDGQPQALRRRGQDPGYGPPPVARHAATAGPGTASPGSALR